MKLGETLTEEQKKQVRELVKGTKSNLKLRPIVSDEEFMAETEVSDSEYKKGIVLPGAK